MKEIFRKWHTEKSLIDERALRVFFQEREIWFSYLGANVGFEQNGKGNEFLRPIIVLKKFNTQILWAVPLTKTKKCGLYYFPFIFRGDGTSTAILSQIRLIDAKRLKYKIGDIGKKDFISLKENTRQLLA